MSLTAPGPIPLAVLTGFLGAGKTTLLNAWLRDPDIAGTAVIVNEFGTVGIDDALIESASGDMLSLVTGCVCCAARGDLVDAISRVLARPHPDAAGPCRIVIETTGLADPGPVLNAMLLAPELAGAVRPERVVTIVSASDGEATLDRHPVACRQVALADRIVLSHTDLPEGAARIGALTHRLAALAPAAPIEDARRALGDVSILLSPTLRRPEPGPLDPQLNHHAADARIRATVLEAGAVPRERFELFVTLLIERFGGALLRLKGLVAVADDLDRPVVIQAVGPLLHPATRLAAWPNGRPRTRLVAILEDVDPAMVSRLWADLFGRPAVDRPDAAGLIGLRPQPSGLF